MKHASQWKLSQRQRECLDLMIENGEGYKAVADSMGVTSNAVQKMLKDVKAKIAEDGERIPTLIMLLSWDRYQRGVWANSSLIWPTITEEHV